MDQQLFQQLEEAIDQHTIAEVIATLAEVCEALAERAMSNWRAADIAAKWQHIAKDLSGIDARIL